MDHCFHCWAQSCSLTVAMHVDLLLSCEALSSDGLKVATSIPVFIYSLWQTQWGFDSGSVNRCFHCSLTVTGSLLSWQAQWRLDSGDICLPLAIQTQWWLDRQFKARLVFLLQSIGVCPQNWFYRLHMSALGYSDTLTTWQAVQSKACISAAKYQCLSSEPILYVTVCRLWLAKCCPWSVAKNWKYCNVCKINIYIYFFKCTHLSLSVNRSRSVFFFFF